MKVLIIDNYDSFTYNLAFYTKITTSLEVNVFRNDEISLKKIEIYDKIILSPGPGLPSEAGILKEIIHFYSGKKPILGVCLGMQAIAEVFGSKLFNLEKVRHAKIQKLKVIKNHNIFSNLPKEFEIGLYHSWAVSQENFSENLEIHGYDQENTIMAISHKKHSQTIGLQFHPESILTPFGKKILENFLLMEQK